MGSTLSQFSPLVHLFGQRKSNTKAETDMFDKETYNKMYSALSIEAQPDKVQDFLKSRPKTRINKEFTKKYGDFDPTEASQD